MLELRDGVPLGMRDAIEPVVSGHRTLEDVVRWGLACKPARLVESVIVQDEYTHDVVVRWSDDAFLVYDTT